MSKSERKSASNPSPKSSPAKAAVSRKGGKKSRPSKSGAAKQKSGPAGAAGPGFLAGPQRLNKVLAAAGLGARRQVDELIEQGRVEVDGETCTEFHRKVDPATSKIEVDGQSIRKQKAVYFAVNKPAGFLCTNSDPQGRPRVVDLVPDSARLFPVGRLDRSSVGLILLTNDGELAQRLAHPKYGVPKSYYVVVQGQIASDQLNRLRRGIYLAEGVARVEGAKIRKVRKGCTELDITLTEGKNREIRRVLARLGHKVMVLRRVAIGPLKLSDMPEGAHRPLTSSEVASLYTAAEQARRDRMEAKKEREERLKSVAIEKAEKRSKRKSDGDADSEDGRATSSKNSKKKGASESTGRPSKMKSSRRIDDDELLDGFVEDDFDGEDFDDGEDFGAGRSDYQNDFDDAGQVVRSGMIEVSPIWNEDQPVSKRKGGVIDYEFDESEGVDPSAKQVEMGHYGSSDEEDSESPKRGRGGKRGPTRFGKKTAGVKRSSPKGSGKRSFAKGGNLGKARPESRRSAERKLALPASERKSFKSKPSTGAKKAGPYAKGPSSSGKRGFGKRSGGKPGPKSGRGGPRRKS